MLRKYGWKHSQPDHRDFKLLLPKLKLPSKVDLRNDCIPIIDQGNLGSCTACSLDELLGFTLKQESKPVFPVSRLFIYYMERFLEGTVKYDSGAEIRDGMKVLNRYGGPHEILWPYVPKLYTTKPPQKVYKDALNLCIKEYNTVDNLNIDALRACLAAKKAVVGGFSVYESFESDNSTKTGDIPYPKLSEKMLGGHAVLFVGYDDSTKRFNFQNSWGPKWGNKGFGTIPYSYVTNKNLAGDFWTVSLTT